MHSAEVVMEEEAVDRTTDKVLVSTSHQEHLDSSDLHCLRFTMSQGHYIASQVKTRVTHLDTLGETLVMLVVYLMRLHSLVTK